MTPGEERAALLAQLHRIAERLPNGLLRRLVGDARFFHEWNLCKRRARASGRLAQYRAWEVKAEERYWKSVRR
jgi:hypothetical protein